MSKNRHKYFNKVPPFKPDHEQCTRKQHSWKEKESYDNDDYAWKFQNQNQKLKALCVAYLFMQGLFKVLYLYVTKTISL